MQEKGWKMENNENNDNWYQHESMISVNYHVILFINKVI